MFRLLSALLLTSFIGLSAPSVKAAPVHDFHNAVADATEHYREAQFYLRTGNPMVASFGLQDLSDKWQAITKQFAKSPPGVYANDTKWEPSLSEISRHIQDGIKATDEGDLDGAKKRLAPIRQILSALRSRSGVFLFSDRVDRANAAMDAIWHFRHNPPDFADEKQVNDLRQKTTLMTYWYEQCRDTASDEVKKDPQFRRLVDRTLYSLGRMWVAISEKNQLSVINILREMRSSDKLLYLHFG
jgi:hypothetical protein